MEKVFYNKLIRDKVPELIKKNDAECSVREMDEDEFKREIVRKIYEEASGVSSHTEHHELVDEVADLSITLDTLMDTFKISDVELQRAIEKNKAEKGGYEKKLFLAWSSDIKYASRDQASKKRLQDA